MTSSGGPYIVELRNPRGEMPGLTAPRHAALSRWAVVDLEDGDDGAPGVRSLTEQMVRAAAKRAGESCDQGSEWAKAAYRCRYMGPEGGTVSLPDGSEVRVEAISWNQLWERSGWSVPTIGPPDDREKREILKAWNEKFGSETQGAGS